MSHMNESCHIRILWFKRRKRREKVESHMNESRHIWIFGFKCGNTSRRVGRHLFVRFSDIWMSHGTYKWVMAHINIWIFCFQCRNTSRRVGHVVRCWRCLRYVCCVGSICVWVGVCVCACVCWPRRKMLGNIVFCVCVCVCVCARVHACVCACVTCKKSKSW